MPAARIDTSILLQLVTAKLAAVTGITVQQLTEPESDALGIQARVIGLKIARHERPLSDVDEDAADVTIRILVLTDELYSETSVYTISKASMLVVEALNEQRLFDAATTTELQLLQGEEEISIASAADGAGEDQIMGVSEITLPGIAKRTTGNSIMPL